MGRRHTIKADEKKILRYELTHFHKIILTIVGIIGFIIFWKGFNTFIDRFMPVEPFIFMGFGFVLMFLTGWFIRK